MLPQNLRGRRFDLGGLQHDEFIVWREVEAKEGLLVGLDGLEQSLEIAHRLVVQLRDDHVVQMFVADVARVRQNLREDNHLLIARLARAILPSLKEGDGCLGVKVVTELRTQVRLARGYKDQTAHDQVLRYAQVVAAALASARVDGHEQLAAVQLDGDGRNRTAVAQDAKLGIGEVYALTTAAECDRAVVRDGRAVKVRNDVAAAEHVGEQGQYTLHHQARRLAAHLRHHPQRRVLAALQVDAQFAKPGVALVALNVGEE
eukprot:5355594-Prymnesium_polylepis.2